MRSDPVELGAFDCQQGPGVLRPAPAAFPLGPVDPSRNLQSRGSRARRVDRPAGCSRRRWQATWISRESRASPCFRGVASGPGPASGEEFRRDDDGFPDIDRRHRQHRGGDRHPARSGEDGVGRFRRGVRGVDEDLVPEDQASPAEGEEKDEQQDAEGQLTRRARGAPLSPAGAARRGVPVLPVLLVAWKPPCCRKAW